MKKKYLTFWFVLLLISLNVSGINIEYLSELSEKPNIMSGYGINHSPIFIDGNMDFTPGNGVTGGSGTKNDPYIIENWNIVFDGIAHHGIHITNTDAYFMIRNCTVSGFNISPYEDWHGIHFNYVDNGKIIDTILFENLDDIQMIESWNIVIKNCSISNWSGTYADGIYMRYCSDVKIISSVIHDKNEGFRLVGCRNILIDGCKIYNNIGSGLTGYVDKQDIPQMFNITISHCEIYNNTWNGVRIDVDVWKSTNVHIKNCLIHHNGIISEDLFTEAIQFDMCNDNIVENCTIHDNGYGVYFFGARNIIRNCSIYNHIDDIFENNFRWGIQIAGAWPLPINFALFNRVEHCDVYNNDLGIWLVNTVGTVVEKNDIYDNKYAGVFTTFWCIPRYKYNNIYGNGYDTVNFSDSAGAYQFRSYADLRNNWWGSIYGPSRFGIRDGDTVKNLLGYARCFPWLLEPVPDAGIIKY